MNVLMMSNTYKPILGGLERSVEILTNELRKKGHKVLIVAPEYPDAPQEEGVIRVPALQNFNGSDFSVQVPVPGVLNVALGNFKPDIVHAHHPFLIGDTALRVAHKFNAPLVFTHHTLYEHNMHYVPAGHTEGLKRFVMELATGYANLADHVFAPSQSVKDLLIERGVNNTPITIVPTGIYTKKYARGAGGEFRKKMKIPQNGFVIGHLGRLAPEKNLEFLAEAVGRYLQKDPKAFFVVAGKGPSEEKIKAIMQEKKVAERLYMVGVVKNKDLIDCYHAMDVFAFASHSETQGLVLAEAMSARVPVVAVDAPGVREVVIDGENGWLIPQDNADDFIIGLQWMRHRTKSQMKKIKEACWKKANELGVEKCVSKAAGVYLSLIYKDFKRRDIGEENSWSKSLGLIKAQWNLVVNMTKATGAILTAPLSDSKELQENTNKTAEVTSPG